jgi:hypothetical protein
MNRCGEAKAMLDCYTAAVAAFHKSQEVLLAGMPPTDPRYPEARRLRERALDLLVRARNVYWNHVTKHKCPRPDSSTDLDYEEN